MSYLSWIDDNDFIRAVKELLSAVQMGKTRAENKFGRNVIDPFSTAFSMAFFGVTREEWAKVEIQRQIDKSLSNAVGLFHQRILSGISGWEDLNNSNQIDLVNSEKKILAELKNKHNTLNAAASVSLYNKLSDLVNSKSSIYKGYTAYYVTIVPKSASGVDELFYPSDNSRGERCHMDDKIRIIDGKRFYALASGEEHALENMFKILPDAIKDAGACVLKSSDLKFIRELFVRAYGKQS